MGENEEDIDIAEDLLEPIDDETLNQLLGTINIHLFNCRIQLRLLLRTLIAKKFIKHFFFGHLEKLL